MPRPSRRCGKRSQKPLRRTTEQGHPQGAKLHPLHANACKPVGHVRPGLLGVVQSLTATGAGDIQVRIDKSAADGLSRTRHDPVLSFVKESLSSSLRHPKAVHRTVTVRLSRGKIRLELFVEGKGFKPTARKPAGMTLASMRTEARKHDARRRVRSRPGKGTLVVLDIPPTAQQAIV